MSSRPPRTSKSDTSKSSTARPEQTGGDMEAGATIKDSSLQRREIPSYSDSREARIAERAYWRAEQRGFLPGQELDDWLQAEREVDSDSEKQKRDER